MARPGPAVYGRRGAARRRYRAADANWTRGDRKARFEQTAERHAGLSQFAAPFLTRMKFVDEQVEGTSPTRSALRVYREPRAAACRPTHPLDFAPTALQPLIRRNGVTDRRRWEGALFLKVRDEIQIGRNLPPWPARERRLAPGVARPRWRCDRRVLEL